MDLMFVLLTTHHFQSRRGRRSNNVIAEYSSRHSQRTTIGRVWPMCVDKRLETNNKLYAIQLFELIISIRSHSNDLTRQKC